MMDDFVLVLEKNCPICGGEGFLVNRKTKDFEQCCRCEGDPVELTDEGKLVREFIKKHIKAILREIEEESATR